MKNSIKSFLVLLTSTLILTSCHSGYEEKDGKIYYKWIHGGNWTREKTLVKQADASTFNSIKNNVDLNLGKDKNHVFKDALILEYADPFTFVQVKEYYWKDKNQVYQLQFGGKDCRILNADPKTFIIINDYLWAKDKNYIFYKFNKLTGVNPKEFMAIDDDWGKDERFYYYHNFKIASLDYNSTEIISRDYIKDKMSVFFHDTIVKDANPKTFKADAVGSFGHDDKYMFICEKNEGLITEQYKRTYIDNK